MTDIGRALAFAKKNLPWSLWQLIKAELTDPTSTNEPFKARLAAEVLSLGESRSAQEDVIERVYSMLEYLLCTSSRYQWSPVGCAHTAREFVEEQIKPFLAPVDPVPEATRDEIERTYDEATLKAHRLVMPEDGLSALGHVMKREHLDALLARYSIFPRHNPGESK